MTEEHVAWVFVAVPPLLGLAILVVIVLVVWRWARRR